MDLTAEEKRASERLRKRDYRARMKLAGAPAPSRRTRKPPSLEASVRASVAAMKQLAESDRALVDVALATARQVDKLIAADDLFMSARIFSGQTALTRMLHELGGSPTVRQQFEFKSRRAVPAPAVVEPVAEVEAGENVSEFRRPEKRARRRG